jgi:hypothetical protein
MRDGLYRCNKTGDCIYKDSDGLCVSLPRYIYLDRYGHYANTAAPMGRYRYRACINYCQYRGRKSTHRKQHARPGKVGGR